MTMMLECHLKLLVECFLLANVSESAHMSSHEARIHGVA